MPPAARSRGCAARCLHAQRSAATPVRPILARTRNARLKKLADFAVDNALLILAARIRRDHPAPEIHGGRISQVLVDFPASRKAVENDLHRGLADSATPLGARDEELGHAVIDACASRKPRHAHNHRKANRYGGFRDEEGVRAGIGEPARDLVGLAMANFAEDRKSPGVERRQVIEIVAIDILDPEPITLRRPRVPYAYCHATRTRIKTNGPDRT